MWSFLSVRMQRLSPPLQKNKNKLNKINDNKFFKSHTSIEAETNKMLQKDELFLVSSLGAQQKEEWMWCRKWQGGISTHFDRHLMATCELIWWTGIPRWPATNLAMATCHHVSTGPSQVHMVECWRQMGEIRKTFQDGWGLSQVQVQMLVFGWRQGRRLREITPRHTRGFTEHG